MAVVDGLYGIAYSDGFVGVELVFVFDYLDGQCVELAVIGFAYTYGELIFRSFYLSNE